MKSERFKFKELKAAIDYMTKEGDQGLFTMRQDGTGKVEITFTNVQGEMMRILIWEDELNIFPKLVKEVYLEGELKK
jgi:hypothetical protein